MRRILRLISFWGAAVSCFSAVAGGVWGGDDWDRLSAAAQDCIGGRTVKLTSADHNVALWANVAIPMPISVQEGGTLTIDLNGHVIATFATGNLTVKKGATLIVVDSTGNGEISPGANADDFQQENLSPIVVEEGATLDLRAGKVHENGVPIHSVTLNDGGCVKVSGRGEIGGNVPIYCLGSARVEVSGSGVIASGASESTSICCLNSGTVSFSGSGRVCGSPVVNVRGVR